MRVDKNTRGRFPNYDKEGTYHTTYKCPNCNCTIHLDWHERRNYCPECGTKLNWNMDGPIDPDNIEIYIRSLKEALNGLKRGIIPLHISLSQLVEDTVILLQKIVDEKKENEKTKCLLEAKIKED